MARIDRVARWIASDILRARGVEKTPATMRAMLPVSYVFAEGVLRALESMTGEMAEELAGGMAVICCPAPAGGQAEGVDMADFEAEWSSKDPDPEQGAV